MKSEKIAVFDAQDMDIQLYHCDGDTTREGQRLASMSVSIFGGGYQDEFFFGIEEFLKDIEENPCPQYPYSDQFLKNIKDALESGHTYAHIYLQE